MLLAYICSRVVASSVNAMGCTSEYTIQMTQNKGALQHFIRVSSGGSSLTVLRLRMVKKHTGNSHLLQRQQSW